MIYIYNNDAKNIDATGLDHCIVDPPYSDDTHSSAVTQVDGEFVANDFGFDNLDEDTIEYISETCAKATGYSLIFSDHQMIGPWCEAMTRAKCTVMRVIPWLRWSAPSIVKGRPPAMAEFVLLVLGPEGNETFSGPGNFSCFEAKCLRGSNKFKTEKPLDLMLAAIEMFTLPGSRVYDPCMGSGTTGVACKILDRHFMGVEKDPDTFAMAKERLESEQPSVRDYERMCRYSEYKTAIEADKERIRTNTDKVKAKRKRAE